jgi:hypothetical protein
VDTSTTWIVVVILIAAIVVAGAVWFWRQRQRSKALQEHFGPEYDYIAGQSRDLNEAEAELEARQKRVEAFAIRPLSLEERGRFTEAWQSVQARFVDEPSEAVIDADRLVAEVMQLRGYPIGDFEQQAADISVAHPDVVANYRAAGKIALDNERGQASTEDLRQAMVYYRALFEELLESEEPQQKEPL